MYQLDQKSDRAQIAPSNFAFVLHFANSRVCLLDVNGYAVKFNPNLYKYTGSYAVSDQFRGDFKNKNNVFALTLEGCSWLRLCKKRERKKQRRNRKAENAPLENYPPKGTLTTDKKNRDTKKKKN